MKLKDELSFSRLGYDLLDQKRSILVSELLTLVDQAVDYQNRVEKALMDAEKTLQDAIMNMGRLRVANLAGAVNINSSISLSERRVMGVGLPKVDTSFSGDGPYFSPEGTSMLSELAINRYRRALELMGKMAELKVSIMRLSSEVKKTIRKVNALEKLVIPDKEETVRYLTSRIEEQERESFILLKAVRRTNGVRHSVFRESRRGTNAAWCKRPNADPALTTAERGGEPPPGRARYSPNEWRFLAQFGWNRGARCFIPYVLQRGGAFFRLQEVLRR